MNEKDIAQKFSAAKTHALREEYIQSLPENIKITKVEKNLEKLSDKVELLRLYYKNSKPSGRTFRSFTKKIKSFVKDIKAAKSSYSKIKKTINTLRSKGESLLIDEALKLANEKIRKHRELTDGILKAESLVKLLRKSDFSKEELQKLLVENKALIVINDIFLENLKDLFEILPELRDLQNDFNNFLIYHVEGNKPIKNVISNAEDRIISGDIKNAYKEIEKAEEIISLNTAQALINIFNLLGVMDVKRAFVKHIKEVEASSIPAEDIDQLLKKSENYRKADLPKKWQEMRHKLKFTKTSEHFKAWLVGLQKGRYKSVLADVKGYITIELMKINLGEIHKKFEDVKIESALLILNNSANKIEDLKKGLDDFLKTDEFKKIDKNELALLFKSFYKYILDLNSYILKEKKIVLHVFEDLKKHASLDEKIKVLKKRKDLSLKEIADDAQKYFIENIFKALIVLYDILLKKSSANDSIKHIDTRKVSLEFNGKITPAMEFMDSLQQELVKTKKIKNIGGKIGKLSEDVKIDVISAMHFNPMFDGYFPIVEDSLYQSDWGRTLGIIGLNIKNIEKKYGMLASEVYLDDLAERVSAKQSTNSFLVGKIKNMKENLLRLHADGAKNLHYLQERLAKAKSPAEKIIELQKLSRDPLLKGIFGTIQNMERILIRDNFEEIYKKVQGLPIETQKTLFNGLHDDLKALFKYEPKVVKKITDYIENINNTISMAKQNAPKVHDDIADAFQSFENNELPLVDLSEMLDFEMPDANNYSPENIEKKAKSIKHNVNTGVFEEDELGMIIDDINRDLSLFKIDGTSDSLELVNNADGLVNTVNENVEQAKKISEFKESKNIGKSVKNIINDESMSLLEQIEMLDTVSNGKDLDLHEREKVFVIAEKEAKKVEKKTKLKEIVEVIRRLEKEVEPLHTLESKVSAINNWIDNDYVGKEHIEEFLENQISEYEQHRAREGGLLRKLLAGLDSAKNKEKYLKDMLHNIEYKHLIPTIKNLLENIRKEMDVEDVNEEWIIENLEGKTDDEKLEWLKVRDEWEKYENSKDVIKREKDKIEKKISGKKSKRQAEIYSNIIDLANAVLDIDGQGARQSFIKNQDESDPDADDFFKMQKKLLFYLFATNNDAPVERLKALANRHTLSTSEKQKYLQILKKSDHPQVGSLKDLLGITDKDIAFYAAYVLNSEKSVDVRIKLLDRFKGSAEPKTEKYKEFFGITDKTIYDVVTFLKSNASKKKIPVDVAENDEVAGVSSEGVTSSVVEENAEGSLGESENESESSDGTEGAEVNVRSEVGDVSNQDVKDEEPEESVGESDAVSEVNIEPEVDIEQVELAVEKEDEAESPIDQEIEDVVDEKTEVGVVENVEQETGDLDIEENAIENETAPVSEDSVVSVEDGEPLDDTEGVSADEVDKEAVSETSFENAEEVKVADALSSFESGSPVSNTETAKAGETVEEDDPLAFESDPSEHYTEEDVKEWSDDDGETGVKSSKQIIEEKKLREKYEQNIKDLVEKKIEEMGFAKSKEIAAKVREKAKEIYEDKEKKAESKLNELLSYLTTCFPEAVTTIIETEILPIFKEDSANLDTHNLLESINNSVFKPALHGLNYEDNLTFLQKKLVPENYSNVNAILEKIIELWKEETEVVRKEETLIDNDKVDISSAGTGGARAVSASKTADDEVGESKFADSVLIENGLQELTEFTKPHAFILELVKKHNLPKENYDVDDRRDIVDRLHSQCRIFTYNGTTYIGKGQINDLVKNEAIPKDERVMFVKKLDAFLAKFDSDEERFDFLGVADAMEFRQLNYTLDKYNGNRSRGPEIVDEEPASSSKSGKPAHTKPVFNKKASEQAVVADKGRGEASDKPKKKDSYKNIFKDRLKEHEKANLKKEREALISKSQQDILRAASKEITKKMERLAKEIKSKAELDTFYQKYFGDTRTNKKALLTLCYDIKQIAKIIHDDEKLLSKLSYDKTKILKIFENKKKKFK